MKEWTDSHVRVPLDEMKNYKAKVESMSMVNFVNKSGKILDQAKKLSSLKVREFEDEGQDLD